MSNTKLKHDIEALRFLIFEQGMSIQAAAEQLKIPLSTAYLYRWKYWEIKNTRLRRLKYSSETIEELRRLIFEEGLSIRSAAEKVNMPKDTANNYRHKYWKNLEIPKKKKAPKTAKLPKYSPESIKELEHLLFDKGLSMPAAAKQIGLKVSIVYSIRRRRFKEKTLPRKKFVVAPTMIELVGKLIFETGLTLEEISHITGLPIHQVREIRTKNFRNKRIPKKKDLLSESFELTDMRIDETLPLVEANEIKSLMDKAQNYLREKKQQVSNPKRNSDAPKQQKLKMPFEPKYPVDALRQLIFEKGMTIKSAAANLGIPYSTALFYRRKYWKDLALPPQALQPRRTFPIDTINTVGYLLFQKHLTVAKVAKQLEIKRSEVQYIRSHWFGNMLLPNTKKKRHFTPEMIELVGKLLFDELLTYKQVSEKTGLPHYVIGKIRNTHFKHKSLPLKKKPLAPKQPAARKSTKYAIETVDTLGRLLFEEGLTLDQAAKRLKISPGKVKYIKYTFFRGKSLLKRGHDFTPDLIEKVGKMIFEEGLTLWEVSIKTKISPYFLYKIRQIYYGDKPIPRKHHPRPKERKGNYRYTLEFIKKIEDSLKKGATIEECMKIYSLPESSLAHIRTLSSLPAKYFSRTPRNLSLKHGLTILQKKAVLYQAAQGYDAKFISKTTGLPYEEVRYAINNPE